jgi:replication factor A1
MCRGTTVELSLAGKRALEFNAEAVFQVGQNNHVIAIFVGTLMKVYIEKTTSFLVEHQLVAGT